MKLPLNWLKDYVDPQLSTQALIERLTMAGLEVEAVETVAGDTVLEIEITPNRPDLLCILGLAREISAMTSRPMKAPAISEHRTSTLKDLVQITDKNDCSRYIATLLHDVQVKDSGAEMTKRLSTVAVNAINNVVDITNFVLMETGQPLHAFDYDKILGGKIVVRRAKAGESITTLDGVERKLDPSILIIADAKRPVAIAGIMGGIGTEITAETNNVLLESAHFDMGLIRAASRKLGLRSDSSYRFERNVSLPGVSTGADRAVDLILKACGGKLAGRAEISIKLPTAGAKVKLKTADIESVLGSKVTAAQSKTWLSRLGFQVRAKADSLEVVAPVSRPDIKDPVDVIEEIARMIGFDHLPSSMPMVPSSNIPVDKRPRQIKQAIREVLTAGGVDEIITLSMTNAKAVAKSRLEGMPQVKVYNPLSQDQELMRPSLLPSFLPVVVTNFNRGQKDLRFFENGKIYAKDMEQEALGILLTGRRHQDWRGPKKESVDIFDLKGLLERVFERTGAAASYEPAEFPAFEAGSCALILLQGAMIGILGKVSREVLSNWDIKNQDIYYAGVALDKIFALPAKQLKYQPISEFPPIVRDVSLAVKKDIPYRKIEEICRQQGGDILKSVQFIEQYLGDKIQAGYKGLVFSCQYQSADRTLREEEAASAHQRVLDALTRELEAVRR